MAQYQAVIYARWSAVRSVVVAGGEDDDLDEHRAWAQKLQKMGRNPRAPWKSQIDVLKIDEAARTAWIQHWLALGLEAMEQLLAEKNPSGKFCHGDSPTVADICLVTQVTPAQLFKCPLEHYKHVMRIYDTCMSIPAFAEAHPRKQPDFQGH